MVKKAVVSCLAVFFLVSYGLTQSSVSVLGHITSIGVRVDGQSVPSGTTLLGKTLVSTSKHPASVHLDSGQTIQFHKDSSAYVERLNSGQLSVVVQTGALTYVSAAGISTALPKSTLFFTPDALPVATAAPSAPATSPSGTPNTGLPAAPSGHDGGDGLSDGQVGALLLASIVGAVLVSMPVFGWGFSGEDSEPRPVSP